jgi:predicted GIY-YIG superfamily endonuclease
MPAFYVYILKCNDASYYTGHTDDIERRLAMHNEGKIDSYTATRLPVELVYCEMFDSRAEAIASEQQIKGWSRAKKEALIASDWKRMQQLAWGTRNPLPERLK